MVAIQISNYKIREYNELEKATTRSIKAEKSVRRIRKRFVNQLAAIAAEEKWDREMERLMKEEIEKKAENPQYKKKTKKQLAEELKPKSTIINLEKFRSKEQEPHILYFEPYGLPVYNSAGKKSGLEAKHREFIKENNDKVWEKRLEKQRQEAQEWAAKREKVMKRRQKAAAKLKRKMISEQLQAEIQQLKEDGSYKIKDGVWAKYQPKTGYFVEIRKFDGIIKAGEYLGIWRDKADNDRLFVGMSILIKDKEKAEALGRKLGERAIWDNANQQEIRL